MFEKILIANRGEIACRVATTARRMGIQTVAVYSDADANALHVNLCDEAVYIGESLPSESYLRIDAIISACKSTGAQAVHPGYGFLSENETFAQALTQAGIVFIGPPAAAIAAMGSKSAAKSLMQAAQVPLTPGYHGDNQDPLFLNEQADIIGYPVIIKASAGGGGKGMRIVAESHQFMQALASCKREALNAFANDQVLVEKYINRPRHIEVQVFADTHGNTVYCFERDCSVQRRHQKVLEEAPAPGMTAKQRQAIGQAAVAAAKAVGYVGAGTVEFIADSTGAFYFMEMNTRLQVEHPVTEMIIGQDLVEWQLRVAFGETLPLSQEQLTITGHSIEARIYAEYPEGGFLPSTGKLEYLEFPPHASFTRDKPVRVDSGVRKGDLITPYYDPMIAKLIVWGENRLAALAHLRAALAQTHIVGPRTNVAFLTRLLNNAAFSQAQVHTGLIEQEKSSLLPQSIPPSEQAILLALSHLLSRELADVDPRDPWSTMTGWRIGTSAKRSLTFTHDAGKLAIVLQYGQPHRVSWIIAQQDPATQTSHTFDFFNVDSSLTVRTQKEKFTGQVVAQNNSFHVFVQGRHEVFSLQDALANAAQNHAEESKLTAPMPGRIVAVLVQAGNPVEKGTPLMVMEAMKMEHTILSPHAGKVETVLFSVGELVTEGAQLIQISET